MGISALQALCRRACERISSERCMGAHAMPMAMCMRTCRLDQREDFGMFNEAFVDCVEASYQRSQCQAKQISRCKISTSTMISSGKKACRTLCALRSRPTCLGEEQT